MLSTALRGVIDDVGIDPVQIQDICIGMTPTVLSLFNMSFLLAKNLAMILHAQLISRKLALFLAHSLL